jgi:hypothetical protein
LLPDFIVVPAPAAEAQFLFDDVFAILVNPDLALAGFHLALGVPDLPIRCGLFNLAVIVPDHSILTTRQCQYGEYNQYSFFHDDNLRSAAVAAIVKGCLGSEPLTASVEFTIMLLVPVAFSHHDINRPGTTMVFLGRMKRQDIVQLGKPFGEVAFELGNTVGIALALAMKNDDRTQAVAHTIANEPEHFTSGLFYRHPV